jgi:hypothetical protein
VRVPVHRQRYGRVAGQLFGVLRHHARVDQLRHKAVAEAVEVGELPLGVHVTQVAGRLAAAPFDRVAGLVEPGGAGGPEVWAEKFNRLAIGGPLARPYPFAGRLRGQEGPQGFDERSVEGDNVATLPLRVAGLHGHDRGRGVQGEGRRREAGQFGGPQPGHAGGQVEHRSVSPTHPAPHGTAPGGGQEPVELVGAERPAGVADVGFHVELGEVPEGVGQYAIIFHEEVAERL